ncbi:MAG: TolC family protein [Bacteroidetes bacterium]|nr:MAG: TolC family protein [Bacteroidota bacterium]TAG87256.1 MAG: TolC family protein [Bacteroidota bacterium]
MKNSRIPKQSYILPWLLLICIWFFIGTKKAKAQEKTTNVWNLQSCIDFAQKNNITIMQNDLAVQTNQNNLDQSKLVRYPTLNANASQNYNFGRSVDPFTNQFVNQQVNSNNFALQASVNLFNGFQTKNTIKRNQKEIEIAKLNVEQAKNNVSLNVALEYLNVLQAKELLLVAEKNVNSTQTQLERTEKLFKAGAVAEGDLINLKATLANNNLAVTNAKNQILLAKVRLQQQMNMPADEQFEIENVNIDNLQVTQIAETPAQIYQSAEAIMPNIKSADETIKSRMYSIEIARGGLLPTLNLNGTLFSGYSNATKKFGFQPITFNTIVGFVNNDPTLPVNSVVNSGIRTVEDYHFAEQVADNFRQQIGFSLNIPIFNQGQVKNNIANSRINLRNAELQSKLVRNQLRQTIEQAYVDALSAYNTFTARSTQAEAQQQSFAIQEKRYNAGASNLADFTISRINRDNASTDLIRSKYDYLFRKKVLDFYQGKPLN